MPKTSEERVADGSAWREFCQMLEVAGAVLQRPGTPDDPLTRAEGVRYLTRLTRTALEAFVEHRDPAAPVLRRMVHETAKMGNDNPDNHYLNGAVSGAFDYRITGNRGTVHWLELATQRGDYGQSRGMPPTGRLDARDLVTDANGDFEIWMSSTAGGPNWLPMTPETGTLIVRQSRLTPDEVLATFHIERVGGDGLPTPLTAEAIDQGLRSAGMLVGGAAAIFAGWAEDFQAHVNRLPRFDQALSDSMGGVPGIQYHHSYWRLAPDECLVIEATPPACDHWNFQLSNHWLESLDYRYFRIHTNSAIAAVEADGTIRLVVAHDDPGHPNWLQTAGHAHGAMCFRWVHPDGDAPEPSCRVVKLAALRRELAG